MAAAECCGLPQEGVKTAFALEMIHTYS